MRSPIIILSLSDAGDKFVSDWAMVGNRERVQGKRKDYREVFNAAELDYMRKHVDLLDIQRRYGYEANW